MERIPLVRALLVGTHVEGANTGACFDASFATVKAKREKLMGALVDIDARTLWAPFSEFLKSHSVEFDRVVWDTCSVRRYGLVHLLRWAQVHENFDKVKDFWEDLTE